MKYIPPPATGKKAPPGAVASKLRIYHRLQVVAHRLQKAADRVVLEAAGITTAQAAVLAVLAGAGPCTQRSVAERLGVNESAVTAMTTRLMALGFVERSRDPADARAWRLRLTSGGRTAMRRITGPFATINTRLERALDADALARLAEALDSIRAELDGAERET